MGYLPSCKMLHRSDAGVSFMCMHDFAYVYSAIFIGFLRSPTQPRSLHRF